MWVGAKPSHIPGEVSIIVERLDGFEWSVVLKHADLDAVPCAWLERAEIKSVPWCTDDHDEACRLALSLAHDLAVEHNLTAGSGIYDAGLCLAPHPLTPCGQFGYHTDDPGTWASRGTYLQFLNRLARYPQTS